MAMAFAFAPWSANPLSDQFPFHLTHERDRPAKAKKAEPQKKTTNSRCRRARGSIAAALCLIGLSAVASAICGTTYTAS
jgi:hypothetical protein